MSALENGSNGSWRTWLLGIIAGLILLGIAGSIVINRDMATQLGAHDTEIKNLKDNLLFRTASRFTREDADRAESRLRTELSRLEKRIERLETKGK